MVGGLNADRAAVLEALKPREGFLKIPTLFCKNPAGFMPAGDDFFVSAGEIDGETVWGNLAEGVISTGLESLLLRRILVLKQPDSCLLHRSPCAKTTPSENGVSLFAALLLSCAFCPLWDNHCAEGWQSGRMRRTRNPVYGYTVSRVRIPPLPPYSSPILFQAVSDFYFAPIKSRDFWGIQSQGISAGLKFLCGVFGGLVKLP